MICRPVMGQKFAFNMTSQGFKVCVGNRLRRKVDDKVALANEGNLPLIGATSLDDLVAHLKKSRMVIMLVQDTRR